LLDQFLHVARQNGPGVGVIKLRRVDADEQVGRGGRRRHGFGDLGNFRDDAARHDEHGVADVHDDGIGLLGENRAGEGVIALELRVSAHARFAAQRTRASNAKCFFNDIADNNGATGFDKPCANGNSAAKLRATVRAPEAKAKEMLAMSQFGGGGAAAPPCAATAAHPAT